MIDPHASVIRDSRRSVIAAEDIVPGDLVLLEPGDRVPADLRLIRVRNLRLDEAALTGESVPVDKAVAPTASDAPLGDRISMAFSGTFVASGNGTGVAVTTGTASQLGRISTLGDLLGQDRHAHPRRNDGPHRADHGRAVRCLRRRLSSRRGVRTLTEGRSSPPLTRRWSKRQEPPSCATTPTSA
jgi:magnesium-transporting ATPase (P-type)